MKTEVSRNYKWGFLLNEQELRRILQTCYDHMIKQGINEPYHLISAKLADGSLIESDSVEDIVSLENHGSKAIERVSMLLSDVKNDPSTKVEIQFQDGDKNTKNWISVDYTIIAKSRDWAFLASSELDERVRRTKTFASSYFVQNKYVFMITIAVFMLATMYYSLKQIPSIHIGSMLESALEKGEVTNPIEAMIFVEKARDSFHVPILRYLIAYSLGAGIPLLLFRFASLILPYIYPSYSFYWGDYVTVYDKRKNKVKIFWTVIVLGVVASLIAGFLLRVF